VVFIVVSVELRYTTKRLWGHRTWDR